jgi:hypothetical protein
LSAFCTWAKSRAESSTWAAILCVFYRTLRAEEHGKPCRGKRELTFTVPVIKFLLISLDPHSENGGHGHELRNSNPLPHL